MQLAQLEGMTQAEDVMPLAQPEGGTQAEGLMQLAGLGTPPRLLNSHLLRQVDQRDRREHGEAGQLMQPGHPHALHEQQKKQQQCVYLGGKILLARVLEAFDREGAL